jgi:hypothetical protein
MLSSGRFWGGVVAGVALVYAYNAYKMSKARSS